jgi:CDP-paratose 2-epimerase
MKVLVTGGCGFLGYHVCEYYRKQGWEVLAYDNLTKHELMRTGYNVEKARDYSPSLLRTLGVAVVKADVRDREALLEAAEGSDFIIHTAAQPAMTIAIERPDLDMTTNVVGTFNVLEAARRFAIPLVSCSTIHVYGNEINSRLKEEERRFTHDPPAIDEQAPIMTGKLTPLHASKRSAECYVQTYIDTYGVKAASFRLTGMYGPNQIGGEDHGWVANFVIKTLLGIPIKVFGTDKQVRDILYVTDAVAAFDAFFHRRVPGIYNIGGGPANIISIGESLEMMSGITGIAQSVSLGEKRHGDLWYFVCDISKAKELLGWEPKVSPHEGIERLVAWAREHIDLFMPGKEQA